ncbi:MAG: xanthine phosphoribosyltransferase [Magnetovibrionaceae bacterium]
MRREQILSWDDIYRDLQRLAALLDEKGSWAGIIAITRGGLVPAALIARFLNIRLVETLCISSYDDKVQGALEVLKTAEMAVEAEGEGWLLVDDLVDTGGTAEEALRLFPKAHFATLYAKPQGAPLVHTHVGNFAQNTWLVFPWESDRF